ncbi:hypothetical protein AAFF_G00143870 [Aldrovandia affinis]|uniref:PKD domain-containing protein n=1 Tax=Aldrovandia affinis TaxID=143900 RepID=A0AAD7T0S0_9TELE|nr:hypothetical protein AAFF_G00143870 [Aldrovandia affinis]
MRSFLVALVVAAFSSAVAAAAKPRTRFTRYRSWNSRMYPVWKDGDSRYRDCWTGGEVTFDIRNDAPTLTGAKATFNIDLRFPQNQTVLPDGQVIWARNCTVNGTNYQQGQEVYPDGNSSNEWSGVFPDGTPFTRVSDKKPHYVFVWKTWGRYWQVADGPSSSITIGTDNVPLGSYTMELVIYHCRGKEKFVPLGYASTQFSVTDQIPFAVSLTQLNDVNEADQSFVQNRAIAFSIRMHDPSEYLKDSDITFNWDFGDNSGTLISREMAVTHTYVVPGSFRPQVVLQAVITNSGCATPPDVPTAVNPTPVSITSEPPAPPAEQGTTDIQADSSAAPTVNPPAPTDDIALAVPASEAAPADDTALAVPASEAAPADDTALAVPASEAAPADDTALAVPASEVAPVDDIAMAVPASEATPVDDIAPAVPASEATPVDDIALAASVQPAETEAEAVPAAEDPAAPAVPAAEDPAEPAVPAAEDPVVAEVTAAAAEVPAIDAAASVAPDAGDTTAPLDEAAAVATAEVSATEVAQAEAAAPVTPAATAPAVVAEAVEAEGEAVEAEGAEMANENGEEAAVLLVAGVEEAELQTAQVPLLVAKRQAPEMPAEDGCVTYRYGSFSTALDIVQGIESVEIVQVANVVTMTAEVEQNAVDLTVTCQGSMPNEVCTIVSDEDCITPMQTVCTEVAPSPECQMILRQFFNDSGVFCINVSMTNDVSLAVTSTRVSVTMGSTSGGTVAAVLGMLVLAGVVGTIALAYKRFKQYRPLSEDPGSSVGGVGRTSVPMLLWNLLSRQTPGESRPLLQGRVV